MPPLLRRLAAVPSLAYRLATSPWRAGDVAMFHYGRCGSTVLCDLVDQHPRVLWDDEVYQRRFKGTLPEQRLTGDPFRLLRLRRLRAGRRFYGFETKLHPAYHLGEAVLDMEPEAFVGRLRRLGFDRFVVLERRNYLRQQISEEVGRQQGRVWHRPAGTPPRLHPVRLDPERVRFGGWRLPLVESFRSRDRLYRVQRRLLGEAESLWLTYEEDVLPDPRIGYRRLCRFLGIEPAADVTVRRARTNPFPLPDLLTNHGEVARSLAGTRWEWMLDD